MARSRGGGSNATAIGTKIPVSADRGFGDPGEIARRDKLGYQPHASAVQPNTSTGGSIVSPARPVRSGKFKFNPPVS